MHFTVASRLPVWPTMSALAKLQIIAAYCRLSMAATMLLTGGFHEDGWADTCDGLGGAVGERRDHRDARGEPGALGHRGEDHPLRQGGGEILERVHREVDLAVQQRLLDLLRESALPAQVCQRHVGLQHTRIISRALDAGGGIEIAADRFNRFGDFKRHPRFAAITQRAADDFIIR